MKIGGIVLIVLGSLSILGGIMRITDGISTEFSLWGPGLLVIGIILIIKAKKKKEKEEEKNKWIDGDSISKE